MHLYGASEASTTAMLCVGAKRQPICELHEIFLNTNTQPVSISISELFLQTSGDCNNLPKISFRKSKIIFCFNGVYQLFCMALARGLAHGAGGADTLYYRYTSVTPNTM
jgi:hypothetical protein